MRLPALAIAATYWLASAAAQDGSDFVYTDEEGHLVLRFAGAEPGSLDRDQIEEIVNVHLSTMVHDRLRADAVFEAEPVDTRWAGPTEHRIARHLHARAADFPVDAIECRSVSCRIVLDHAVTWRVAEHQSVIGDVERAIRQLIDADPTAFEPVFLIAGHYQEPDRPYIKLFLRRAEN